MSWTLSTSGAALIKAGANADAALIVDATKLATLSDEAESDLIAFTGYDWITNYASVKTNWKPFISKAVAARIAMGIVKYNPSYYKSKAEAYLIANMNDNEWNDCLNVIKDKEWQKKMIS